MMSGLDSYNADRPPLVRNLKIAGLVILGLSVLGVAAVLIFTPPNQNLDDQEPVLEIAGNGSKLSGIQALIKSGGLSWEQYKKVYAALNEKLSEMEPNSNYFCLVEDSLGATASSSANEVNVVIEPSDYDTYTDPDEVIYEEDPSMITEREEMEIVDTVLFTMRSESDTEYAVEVYTAGDLTTAKVKVEKK